MIAYWIAFGPHGPRAQAPKGEGLKVFSKVVQLVAASCAVFYVIHLFGKPLPRTMTKEYQEASNEYARVCTSLISLHCMAGIKLTTNSKSVSTPSTVSAKRDTRARALSRAPRRRRSKLGGHENEEQVLQAFMILDEQFSSLLAVYPVALTYATTTKDPRCWSGIFLFRQATRKSVYFVLCNNRLYFFCSHRTLHYVSHIRVVLVCSFELDCRE